MNRRFAIALFTATATAACGGQSGPDAGDTYADAMATEHCDEVPTATPAAEGAEEIATQRVAYGEGLDGVFAPGHAGHVSGVGVVLVHEWWGLNDNITGVAQRFAGEGFPTLAVDMYGGGVADTPEAARELMVAALADPEAAMANIAAAAAWLRGQGAEKVVVLGFCFGGAIAIESAIELPESLDGAVVYYGRVPEDLGRVSTIDDPMLLHFGERDSGIPLDSAVGLGAALEASGVDADLHVYEGADHAFANPSGGRYDAAAAELSWARTLEFLRGL